MIWRRSNNESYESSGTEDPDVDLEQLINEAKKWEEEESKPWYFNIKQYIEDKEYPSEASNNDKRKLRRLAAGFFLSGNVLYKRNHDIVLLRCVDAREAEQMLIEVHEGSFGRVLRSCEEMP